MSSQSNDAFDELAMIAAAIAWRARRPLAALILVVGAWSGFGLPGAVIAGLIIAAVALLVRANQA